jgi:GNAT superfamily N-acetyltransferase
MSLWADYIQELRAGTIQFLEHDFGFISYTYPEWAPTSIKVCDIYVAPGFRKDRKGTFLLEEVCEIGRKAGKTSVIAELELNTATIKLAFRSQVAAGFLPMAAHNGIIHLQKEI